MIAMSLRTFKIKVLIFIFIKSPLYKRFGRHSTTDIPYMNYTKVFIIIQRVLLYFVNLINTLVHWHLQWTCVINTPKAYIKISKICYNRYAKRGIKDDFEINI